MALRDDAPPMKNSALSELARRTPERVFKAALHGAQLRLDRPGLVSLAAGFTDDDSLPVEEDRELLQKILSSKRGRPALQYGSPIAKCASASVARRTKRLRLALRGSVA